MVTLRHDGFRKVREGLTTVEEIIHATGDVSGFSDKKMASEAALT